MGGHGLTRICTFFSFNYLTETFQRYPTAPHIDERTNNGPNHVAQKTVCAYFEVPSRRRRLVPLSRHHLAKGRLHIGMSLTECAEILIFH